MKRSFRTGTPVTVLALLALGTVGCSDDSATGPAQADVVANYATFVSANYVDTLSGAKRLAAAVHAFTDAPSEKTLSDARKAWIASRAPYALSEAYRFSQGPIDNDDQSDDVPEGPEGLINSWPVDESYIDYVEGPDGEPLNGGIINLTEQFPTIDAAVLTDANANPVVGETSISTGYHAIEFLLWGQDLNVDGPGDRPYTDYVTDGTGSAENQDRRAEYLNTVADLLVDDLSSVNDAWLEGEANYRADFLALPAKAALAKMLLGMGSLSGAELAGERMQVAYDNKDQEDEHSCFSDTTLNDLLNDAVAVQNVLLGNYADIDGPGIDELVAAEDPALAKKLRAQIQSAIDEIKAVPAPFDQAILGDDDSEARQHILAAIDGLKAFTQTLVDAAKVLDIDLKFDE